MRTRIKLNNTLFTKEFPMDIVREKGKTSRKDKKSYDYKVYRLSTSTLPGIYFN